MKRSIHKPRGPGWSTVCGQLSFRLQPSCVLPHCSHSRASQSLSPRSHASRAITQRTRTSPLLPLHRKRPKLRTATLSTASVMQLATGDPLGSFLSKHFPGQYNPASSDFDALELCPIAFPDRVYSDSEKASISDWAQRADGLRTPPSDETSYAEALKSLNVHLASRTTILGSKPSPADLVLYSRVAPSVASWGPEERTGEKGYHHIVRFVDFVQNSPFFGTTFEEAEKINIDVDDVKFFPKQPDAKEKKEREKKEKAIAAAAAATGTAGTAAVVESKDIKDPNKQSKKDKIKEKIEGVAEALPTRPKKEKQPKPAKQPAKETPLSPSLIDLRVGHILKAVNHPNADSLYVSTIACGDSAGADNTSEYEGQVVRTVCSGLNGLVPLDEMQGRKVVVVCNLKPVTMRGVKSAAMVLAASPRLAPGVEDNHAGPVELVSPPAEAAAGERVCFQGWEGEPEGVLNPKKKVWDMCQAGFTTTAEGVVGFDPTAVEQLKAVEGKRDVAKLTTTGGGACTVKTLKGAVVR